MTLAAFPAWLQALLPEGIRRHEHSFEGVRIHWMECGPADGRPVFCVHGNPTWGFLYREVARALAGDPVRLILPDLMGLGFSDKVPAHMHTLDRHGRLLGALVRHLDLQDAIFVGQDWGGAIGLLAFEGQAERLGGMVILNTVVGPPKKGFKPTLFHRFAHSPLGPVIFRGLGFPQNAMWVAQGDGVSLRGDVRRAYVYPLRHRRDRDAPIALARMVPDAQDHPSIPALVRAQAVFDGFEGPVEIVWGDRDPVLGTVRSWIQKLKPDARVTRTDAGHFLQEQVPGPIADAIRRLAT